MSGATAIEEITDQDIANLLERQLVVYNDDHNDFGYIIASFIEILKFTEEQSSQLALLIHTHGKQVVKSGSYEELEPLATTLLNKQINAEVK